MMNKFKTVLAAGVACVTLLASAGCSYLLPAEEEPLAPPLVETSEISYVTVEVERGDVINQVKRNGSLRSSESMSPMFENQGGRLAEIVAHYGDEVKEGDILLRLINTDVEYAYQVAEINYKIATLNYEKQIGYAYGDAKTIMEYQYQLQTMEYERTKAAYENTILRAPMDGVVSYMASLAVGDVLEAYKIYYTIADPDDLELVVTGDASYDFISGRDVTVVIKEKEYEGKVLTTPADDPEYKASGNKAISARAVIEVKGVPKELWTIGRDCSVYMIKESRENVLTLPSNAIRTYGSRTYVQVLEDGVKVEKDVELGLTTNSTVEILSGLDEGEVVIIS